MISSNVKYDVKEILTEHHTDFSILREKPHSFCADGEYLVCAPVKYYEHPKFIQELSLIITAYWEIFRNVSFLSAEQASNNSAVQKAISNITIFSTSKIYEKFVKKALPVFVKNWAYTIKNSHSKKPKLIKISSFKAKKILKAFTIDELLEVFLHLFIFNYDIVKKKTFDLIQRLQSETGTLMIQKDSTFSDGTGKNTELKLPKFSHEPFSKSDLKQIELMSSMQ